MSGRSSCGTSNGQSPSRMSLQSAQTMSLAKTLHVQDQIIEQLRADHSALREALEVERNTLRDCRITSDKELKALQRENLQLTKVTKQQEVKIEELEKAVAFAKESLASEEKNLKSLEKEHINTVKELKLRNSKEFEKANKQEMIIDQLKSEVEDLKEALESERNATNLLIREHNAEVKMLREEVRTRSTEAYRELKERAIRERDEYRKMQEEAENTYKVLEKDFRDALAAKDEEMKKVKAEARLIQKELEDQLRASLKEPTAHLNSPPTPSDYLNRKKMRRLKHEVSILRDQNRKLLNELELVAGEDKMNEIKREHYFLPFSFQQLESDDSKVASEGTGKGPEAEVASNADKPFRTEINRLGSESNFKNLPKRGTRSAQSFRKEEPIKPYVRTKTEERYHELKKTMIVLRNLGEIRGKNRTIMNLARDLSESRQATEKVRRLHDEEMNRIKRRFYRVGDHPLETVMDTLAEKECEAASKRPKPKPPIKLLKPTNETRSTHVKEIVRRLQERHQTEENGKTFPLRTKKISASTEEGNANQTMEDLKAIDEDIEKLRKQIEERDKIISALREAAEAKDKKLDHLMAEYGKMQTERAEPECRATVNGEARGPERNLTAFSTSPSPPLCNGELCWTDGFVNKNYHEPVYAQLLNDHTALQKIYNELREKLELKSKEMESDENQNFPRRGEPYENGINLIMAEQIRILKEREAQLMSEAEELREQNDLMEFRILELEECRKEEMINEHKHRNDKNIWSERDLEEVSDSGVMSLPTSEDLTSDSELGDTIKNYLTSDSAIVPTLFPQIPINCAELSPVDLKQKKILRNAECLQESGIFEDPDGSEGDSPAKQSRGCQTESLLDKTLLEIIDSSCDLILSKNRGHLKRKTTKSDDLTTEISKLSEIQKRIQEKRENSCETPRSGHRQSPGLCPHANSAVFYEERLRQLEDKLKIYESSGDTKDVLLRKRLEKEIELSHRVKELTERVSSLELINRQIEEEKCEFEEAENDSRFQCQRLEVRVEELMEKNSELELELERQKMMTSSERRKTKEKQQLDAESISMLETAIPAIVAWNMFCLNQTKEEISEHLQSEANLLDEKDPTEFCKSIAYPDGEVFQKLEELITDQKKLRVEYEKAEEEARHRETDLKRKIDELESKSSRDREMLEEMTTYLKAVRGEDIVSHNSDSVQSSSDFEMMEELKHLAENEMKMRRKIDTLERKEQAYLQTLQQADEIWAGMEAEYKEKLAEAEKRAGDLEKRRLELEEALEGKGLDRKVDALTTENEELRGKMRELGELDSRVRTLEEENTSLKGLIRSLSEELPLEKRKSEGLSQELEVRREQYIQDKLTIEQLGKDLEEKSRSLEEVETTLHGQISDLTQELSVKSRELSNLEVTVAELREEVETLENKVTELVSALQNTRVGPQQDNASSVQTFDPRFGDGPRPASSFCGSATDIPVMKVIRVKCQDLPDCAEGDPLPDEEGDPPPNWIDSAFSTRSESEVTLFEREQFTREITFARESELPAMVIVSPIPEPKAPIQVELLPLSPNPEILNLISDPWPKERILRGYSNRCVDVEIPSVDAELPVERTIEETQTIETGWSGKEVEELSLTNQVLQKNLERMEEESRLKDLELIELQKTVSEIRKEQQEIEQKLVEQTHANPVESKATETSLSICGSRRGEDEEFEDPEKVDLGEEDEDEDEEDRLPDSVELMEKQIETVRNLPDSPRESEGLDVLQIFRPILVKSPQKVKPSMSNLQVALDNLQNKCRLKNAIFRAVLEELNEKLGDRCCEEILKRIVPDFTPDGNLYELDGAKGFEPRSSQLKFSESKTQLTHYYPRSTSSPRTGSGDFSFTPPITTMRKVGLDGLFLEWETNGQPPSVVGFEICVNGNLHHKVRSATRNKALLNNMNFRRRNTISLYPVSAKGRSVKCTSVVFPGDDSWN